MKKQLYSFSKKAIIKYLLILMTLLLAAVLFVYFCQKKTISKPKLDHTEEIKKLTDIADIYFDNGKKDSAIYTFNKVKHLCDPRINTIDYVDSIELSNRKSRNQFVAIKYNFNKDRAENLQLKL
jgi:hypothetical protein